MHASAKIPLPNYTQIPNIILDHWLKILSPYESCIIMFMCRKIFGFHKEEDKISISQIAKGTGQTTRGIINHIKNLIKIGLISRIKGKTNNGDDDTNLFIINLECHSEVVNTIHEGSECHSEKVVNTIHTQKKNYTKEKPTTEREAAPAAAVFDCLKEIEIPQSEKEWLSQHHSESVLKHAVAYCTHKDTKIKTSLIQTLKWAAKTLPDIPIDMDVAVSENRRFAEQVAKEGTSLQEVVLEACLKYAEFKFPKSPCAVPICIEYDDKNFMTNFKAALKLYRFGKRILCS